MDKRQYVRCCEYTQKVNDIYFDEIDPCFRLQYSDDPVEYCPTCGILLDMNLDMSE